MATELYSSSSDFRAKAIDWSSRWSTLRGRFPFFLLQSGSQSFDSNTVIFLKRFKSRVRNLPIDVIVDSPGGEIGSSFKATKVFQSICDYRAVVPRYAKSGATLFCLGSDEILMGAWAELGPLDPQVVSYEGHRHYFREQESTLESFHAARFAQAEVLKHLDTFFRYLIDNGLSGRMAVQESVKLVEATIGKIYSNVSPFELGASGRLLDVMEKYCRRVMADQYSEHEQAAISRQLVWNYPGHDYDINYDEARAIGLKVKEATPEEQELLDELEDFWGNVSCVGIDLPNPPQSSPAQQTETPPDAADTTPIDFPRVQPAGGNGNGENQ